MRVLTFLSLLFVLAVSYANGLVLAGLPKDAPKPVSAPQPVKAVPDTQNQATTATQPVKR